MRILNIGLDKTLVGGRGVGDAVARHREYGRHVESLDIIVYTSRAEALPVFKISDKVTGYPTNSTSKFSFLFGAVRIASRIHQQHPFDIIVAQDPFGPALVGWILKKKFGCKLQINFHGDFWENDYWRRARALNRFLLSLSRFLVRKADGVRVVSSGIQNKLIAAGIPESKIALISTPVNFEALHTPASEDVEAVRQGFGNKKIILFAGRLAPEKNLSWLVDVFSQIAKIVPEAVLILVGTGETREKLGEQVRRLKLENKVFFVDTLSPRELVPYYYACEVVVLPSLTESFGKVLVEAGLAGKPVVATATTGAQEIVEDGRSGYLVPIGDGKTLRKLLVELITNPEKARHMGEYARQLMQKKFDRKEVIGRMVEFWKKLLN